MHEHRVVTQGLQMPEGPVALADGSLLVCEMEGRAIARVDPVDGAKERIASFPGAPNGAALGPDGRVYVCDNGGMAWTEYLGYTFPAGAPEGFAGGSIQRLDLETGAVETLYEAVGGRRLSAPNDIVFDASGGFWFTDFGKDRGDRRDLGRLCYAKPDGSEVRDVLPLMGPNGVGISPDGSRLWVSLTDAGILQWWELTGPGELAVPADSMPPAAGTVAFRCSGHDALDSFALDAAGNVLVSTLMSGAFTVVPPDGGAVRVLPVPDPLPTNVCFGGPGLRTAYATLAATGTLIAFEWPAGGAPLHYGAR